MKKKGQLRSHPAYVVALVVALAFILAVYNYGPLKAAFISYRVHAELAPALDEKKLAWGAPVYLRIYKEEKKVEVWLYDGAEYLPFATYPVCSFSGKLGPKVKEGDHQSPEGFYEITEDNMNPRSSYHLSFNLDFPNAYDRANGRTGSFLMVHGDCVSVGCYAITDENIEKVYSLMQAAFNKGQEKVHVHIFPFEMTAANMGKHKNSKWITFWRDLKLVYNAFEKNKTRLPEIAVREGRYGIVSE